MRHPPHYISTNMALYSAYLIGQSTQSRAPVL